MERLKNWLKPWADWRRKRFWLLAALLAWTLFGFLGAPPLLERGLKQAVEASGRNFEAGDVYVNPFALSLRIEDLAIRDPDGTDVIGFDQLYVNFQLSSIFYRAWTFDQICLDGLHVEEERFPDGATRLQRLAEDLADPAATADPKAEDTPALRLIIHDFVLEDGSFEITDRLAGDFHDEFGPVTISAHDIRTLPEHAGDTDVSIGTPGGGVISWRGDLQLLPLSSTGNLTIRGRGLPAILRYADHFLPVELRGETLDAGLDYSVRLVDGALDIAVQNWSVRTGEIAARLDGSEVDFLELDGIVLTGGRWRWPEKTVHAKSLVFGGLDMKAWLDERGRLGLLDALPAAATDSTKAPDDANPGWQISLENLAVENASIEFEDRSLPSPASVRVEELGLTLNAFDNLEGTEIPAELSLALASGGAVSYSGSVVVLPALRLDGQVSVTELALPVLQPWLAQRARLELTEGSAGLEAEVRGESPDFMITGNAAVSGLELLDTRRAQRLAAFESLAVESLELDLGAASLKTSPIDLEGAFGRIHIFEDQSTNLQGLAIVDSNTSENAGDNAAAQDRPPLTVTVGGIEVEDGALDFSDDSLPLPFRAAIRDISGRLSTLATDSSEPSRIDLEGQVNEFGEARIEGTITPWEFTRNSDIDMIFRNLQMSDLSPYTIQYAGYAVEGGRLDMDLGYTLDERRVEGENKVIIRELLLGDKVEHPDAASLPLKLAVALLKDSEGVIDVDLPISGDLDDPAFEISGIIWKAIGNLVTRIVSSPFRFLGSLVGVDSEDFGTLHFRPGRADISPPDREQLLKLVEAMRQRPELSVVVDGVYAERLDRPALAEQAFETRFEAARTELLESGATDLINAERATLETLFSDSFPAKTLESIRAEHMRVPAGGEQSAAQAEPVLDEPAYLSALRQQLIAAEDVGDARLRELASSRAQNVVETLREAGGGESLAVRLSDEVERGEAEEGTVPLELEVAVEEKDSRSG